MRLLVLTMVLCAAGCAGAGAPQRPVPVVLPDNARGFSHAGVSVAFESEAELKEDLAKLFTYACGGTFELLHERIWKEENRYGIEFWHFDLIAKCLTP